jgi:hypothetical protein
LGIGTDDLIQQQICHFWILLKKTADTASRGIAACFPAETLQDHFVSFVSSRFPECADHGQTQYDWRFARRTQSSDSSLQSEQSTEHTQTALMNPTSNCVGTGLREITLIPLEQAASDFRLFTRGFYFFHSGNQFALDLFIHVND